MMDVDLYKNCYLLIEVTWLAFDVCRLRESPP